MMEDNQKPRISTTRTFPVSLHHRNRSEAARPSNQSIASRGTTEERQPWARRLFIDTSVDAEPNISDNPANNEKPKSHRYSKSRDHHHRLPKAVNQIASAGGARNLLPNKSFHSRHSSLQVGVTDNSSKHRDVSNTSGGDFGPFLKPIPSSITSTSHHDSSRSLFGSRSSSAHNNSRSGAESLVVTEEEDDIDVKLGLNRGIQTMEDLKQARGERERGEEFLRSKLASIGNLATDITRRLDYTYYNLLERITALYSTINSFQELVDSSAVLHETFQRDNSNLEQDTRKQIEDFQNFEPQRRRIVALENRMKAGRSKMENLGNRIETVRKDIEGWERREGEWQARVTRRLRLLWSIMGSVLVVVIVASAIQNWHSPVSPADINARIDMLTDTAAGETPSGPQHTTDVDIDLESFLKSPLLSKATIAGAAPTTTRPPKNAHINTSRSPSSTDDPLHLFDEL